VRDTKSRKPSPAEVTPTKSEEIRLLIYAGLFIGAVVAAFVWQQSHFGKVMFGLLGHF